MSGWNKSSVGHIRYLGLWMIGGFLRGGDVPAGGTAHPPTEKNTFVQLYLRYGLLKAFYSQTGTHLDERSAGYARVKEGFGSELNTER